MSHNLAAAFILIINNQWKGEMSIILSYYFEMRLKGTNIRVEAVAKTFFFIYLVA